MTTQSDIIKEMVDSADDQSEQTGKQIDQVDTLINDYDEKIDAVENGVCVVAKDNLTDYLTNTKLPELQLIYGMGLYIQYGTNFGTIDYDTGGITDFQIVEDVLLPIPGTIVRYEYLGVGWDSDSTITKLVDEYAYSNDYLTRPLDSGATYGLIPNRDSLLDAKSILENNKQKGQDSKTSFADYSS